MHSNWRDCVAWRDQNLPMTTTSNEACKLYDISLSQLTGYYENPQFNGFMASIDSMIAADPNFILGHCFKLGVDILGSDKLLNSQDLVDKNHIVLQSKAQLLDITKREQMHVKAVQLMQRGALVEACDYYEQILLEHPTDMMAIKFSQSCYFYMGESVEMRDSVARVMPVWKKTIPLHNYLYGMYAFGLVETNRSEDGHLAALKGLDFEPKDAWSTHAIAHANEYSSKFESGLKFLQDTECHWSKCGMLAPHNYWHMTLFHLELNQHEKAKQLLDEQLMNSQSPMDLVNSASLLIRLDIDGFKATEYMSSKWLKLKDTYISRIEEHGYLYYDIYMALVLGICGSEEEKSKYFKSLTSFLDSENILEEDEENTFGILKHNKAKNFLLNTNREFGAELLNALCYFGRGEFDEVVALLYPIRYLVFKTGGSNAQRDLLKMILIYSALNSELEANKRIGCAILNERLAMGSSNVLERISARFLNV